MQPKAFIDLTIKHAHIVAFERKLQASKTNICYMLSTTYTASKISQ